MVLVGEVIYYLIESFLILWTGQLKTNKIKFCHKCICLYIYMHIDH